MNFGKEEYNMLQDKSEERQYKMNMICEENEIRIRELEKNKADMNYILKWINNEKVSKYYGGIKEYTIDEVIKKYEAKINDNKCFPCIIEFNQKAVGYIQFYYINNESYEISKKQYRKLIEDEKKQ